MKDDHLLEIWNYYLSIQKKALVWDVHNEIKNDKKIKEEDRPLVSLARSSQAILITNDHKLIDLIKPNQKGSSESFNIRIKTAKEANLQIAENILLENKQN